MVENVRTFVRIHETYNTKNKPKGMLWNLDYYDMSMQVYPWEKKKKSTILVSDADYGEAVHV